MTLRTLPLRWSGVGGLRLLPRATTTDLNDRSGETGNLLPGTSLSTCGCQDSGRTKCQRIGRKKDKLLLENTGENKTEPFEGKTKPNQRTIPQRCDVKGGGDNPRNVMRGRPGVKIRRETHQEQERRNPWRTGIGR